MKTSPPRGSAGGFRRAAAIVALSALAAACATLFLSGFSFGFIDGRSMLPGLTPGRFIVATSWAYGLRLGGVWRVRWSSPGAGEVICLISPEDGKRVVKRVAAVHGDICESGAGNSGAPAGGFSAEGVADGSAGVMRAGRFILPASPSETFHFPPGTRVGEGTVFVAGDNPRESVDSRQYGFVAVEQVLGKVLACGTVPAAWNPPTSGRESGD